MSQNGETEELDRAQPQDISLIAGPVNRLNTKLSRNKAAAVAGAILKALEGKVARPWLSSGACLEEPAGSRSLRPFRYQVAQHGADPERGGS